ncbi:MAG TPA: BlaI/MecI/CopY family transcriptional regulator [Gemmatimonadales bacterium]|nr:BlaI/MecI/CopY family transcriptional regulator [Gemmatimonadales bacterium]
MSPSSAQLGRRERQIMDAVFQLGKASVADVRRLIPEPPSYSAVRAMLGTLEDKGLLRHQQDGLRYIYRPTVARETAQHSALKHVVRTFFGDSPERAVAALLDMSDAKLTPRDVRRLTRLVEGAKAEGR